MNTNATRREIQMRKPTTRGTKCDRLAVEGGKVKIFRQNNSVEELRRGIKQLAALFAVGARFEEILIQVR
jgi:hypothetical protein